MPETLNYDTRHYCVVCEDCGQQSDYDGRIGNTDNCQHVNTTANYECHCNLWSVIIIHSLFDKWASDNRYLRKSKYNFEIVDCDTGEVFKRVNRYEILNGHNFVRLISGDDNQEFTQRWTLSGASLTIHHKSAISDNVYVIRSGRD